VLVIAGEAKSSYAAKLQEKIAAVKNVALIPEFIPNDRIHLFFSAASVVVLPYQKVLNSGSLILSMSYGLPTIAPNLSSIAEYLETATQLLYAPEDEQGYSNP
jgi:glycosyltransferase involved in cell wall biosynthesis